MNIHIVTKRSGSAPFRFALFDFDGTISLIREGWQGIMTAYFLEELKNTPAGRAKSEEDLRRQAMELIALHTGKQTIYQCIALGELVLSLEGVPLEAQKYKDEYQRRLLVHIDGRLSGLRNGTLDREALTVPGSYPLLDLLKDRGLTLYLASGTDENYVLDEARLLRVDHYFDGRIYGAQRDHTLFSKKMVIEKIIRENNLSGGELLGFGDGYVEIENVVNAKGYAVGVASNEGERRGIDLWKRERLLRAGAHMIIPDYRDIAGIEESLFGPKQ
ncbi:MAG: hypothetical protein PHQ85_04180 [Eubacteriales bacterium]|jgi:phosphoglycolate phosphatase-like HAD superfamily hydrolase|nr:hypothetical protein [Eubacteriales bacterium]MDD4710352.1 hypothetical protein [Eubacteriales bacterium]NLO16026.1 HAD family hydrolase [Clostridiales bacterium]